ncbi:MAG: efflux RND transporter periplasmic adaptor subunit [bacterium]
MTPKAKKWLYFAVAAVIVVGGYYYYKKSTAVSTIPSYVTAQASRGTLVVSLSSSGQVSATNQVEITPKMSGTLVFVSGKPGDRVKAGQLLASIDSSDLAKAVRDAKTNLETAKLSLDKLMKPAETLTLLQAQNSLDQAKQTKIDAINDQVNIYEDSFTTISNAYLELPAIMAGIQDTLYTSSVGTSGQWNIDYYASAVASYDERALTYKDDAYAKYKIARTAYDLSFAKYKNISRASDDATLEEMTHETYVTVKAISDALKSGTNVIQFYKDKTIERGQKTLAIADTHLTSLNGYTSKTNTELTSLANSEKTITDNRQTILNSDKTIAEREQSLLNVQAPPDALDIRSQNLAIEQKQNALWDAQSKYADAYIRAPFDGVLAKFSMKYADTVSTGSSVATIITDSQLATISFNEVDVAKVKIDQKATMTFDAIPDLILTGHVAEIDSIGTTSQGVVTYSVKILFDAQDPRVRPGMSTSASIITDAKPDVLMLPRSAVKTQGTTSYVQTLQTASDGSTPNAETPKRVDVVVGLMNDESVEIKSGITETEFVITRTIQAGAAAAAKPATSILPMPGAARGMGGGR